MLKAALQERRVKTYLKLWWHRLNSRGVMMLLHKGHWIGCSATQLRYKRNCSLNSWCGAAEEPIYFQYTLIDMMLRRFEKQI